MGFSAEQLTKLRADIDPEIVAQRSQAGQTFVYVEGFTAIDQANDIFGFADWGYTVGNPQTIEVGNKIFVYVPVTVNVRDPEGLLLPPRTDLGTGIVEPRKGEITADAYEMAFKGAATDGLKRALRSFGNQFGNSLYDKDSPDNTALKQGKRPTARPTFQPGAPCETPNCPNRLVGYHSNRENKDISPKEQEERTRKMFGKALCTSCMVQAAKQPEKAA